MTNFEDFNQGLQDTRSSKHLSRILLSYLVLFCELLQKGICVPLFDYIRPSKKFAEQDSAIVPDLARVSDILFRNIDDPLDQSIVSVSLLFGINGGDIERNKHDDAQPKSEHARIPVLLHVLEVEQLNARLHVRSLMREELHKSLVASDTGQIVKNFKEL